MKKENPTLTIITVCFNIKNEIERTCKSIVNQTWQDFEWIVVDGGSTDGTVDILKKYTDRINILISEPDKGIYNAMNKGIKLAHGKWLNFMNGGDCLAYDDVLEKVFKYTHYSSILQGKEERYSHKNKLDHIFSLDVQIDKFFFLRTSLAHQSMFFQKKLFDIYGLYDENYQYCADTEKNLQLISSGVSVELLPFVVSRFWLTGISQNNKSLQKRRYEHNKFNKKYFSLEELNRFINSNKYTTIYKLFNFIPFLTIENI